jgi:hypothetical protein
MQITIYPEFHESRSEDLRQYIDDKLRECFYESGEMEGIHDKLDNLIITLSNLLEVLVEKKKLTLKDVRYIVKNSDYIGKDESE